MSSEELIETIVRVAENTVDELTRGEGRQVSLPSNPVFRIRIHRIHMFLGLPDTDPLVRGMDPDPDPSIIKQK
jgi:hypothetical protein